MTGRGGGKEVKYNEMDLLILDVLERTILRKVWTVMTVVRLTRRL
jgi:hypothetical protein